MTFDPLEELEGDHDDGDSGGESDDGTSGTNDPRDDVGGSEHIDEPNVEERNS
ncbi:hypothetical protein ACFQMM_13080 [Saliphagus sp. GCM10025308]